MKQFQELIHTGDKSEEGKKLAFNTLRIKIFAKSIRRNPQYFSDKSRKRCLRDTVRLIVKQDVGYISY